MFYNKLINHCCKATKLFPKINRQINQSSKRLYSLNAWSNNSSNKMRILLSIGLITCISYIGYNIKIKAKEPELIQEKEPIIPNNDNNTNNANPIVVNNEGCEKKKEKCKSNMLIFSGNANLPLAQKVADYLGVKLGSIYISNSSINEIDIKVETDIRGKDIFIIQPTCPPVNQNLFELMLMISTMRRGGSRRITAVIPYYGYARQDRKNTGRVPISAADVARLIEAMGVDRVVAVDLHCAQIQGFFGPRVPVDNLEGGTVGVEYFGNMDMSDIVIVSPDAGGVHRAKSFRDNLSLYGKNADMAMIIKQRITAGEIGQMDLVGSVKGKHAIIVDDMIDTAGTLCTAAQQLVDHGALSVFAFASHGVFSKNASSNISNSVLKEVVVLDTIPLNDTTAANEKIKTLSIAPLLAKTITALQNKKSVSQCFPKFE